MIRIVAAALALALLAGCGTAQRISPFARAVPQDPLPFQARLNRQRGSPEFSVSVATRGAPLEQWRESARFQGTRHCIQRFGSSDIVWASAGGPDDWLVSRTGDGGAVVRGRCDVR